jgi:hypothetical protein
MRKEGKKNDGRRMGQERRERGKEREAEKRRKGEEERRGRRSATYATCCSVKNRSERKRRSAQQARALT